MGCKVFSDSKVYFASSVDDQEKRELLGLVSATCERIQGRNPNDMIFLSNTVDFIVYKPIDNGQNIGANSDGGTTLRSSGFFLIVYYPNPKRFIHRETKLYILAHEFAHVRYEHPAKSSCNSEEREGQKIQFEIEADRKAIEWGFRPHEDEIGLFPTYQSNLLAGRLDC